MSGQMAMGGVLILACVCMAGSSPSTALDQLDAVAERLGQVQVDFPEELFNAQDLQAATKAFMAWQAEMIGQRDQLQRSYSRLLKERTKVPPPPTPGAQQPPPMTRLDVPLPFPTDLQLSLSYGQPQMAFNVRAETKVMSFVGASYKAGVGYCASDNKWLVADALQISTGLFGTKVEPAWTMQMYSSVWGQPDPVEGRPKGVELSVELAKVKGVIGYNSDGQLSLGADYDLLSSPKAFSRWLDASFGISAEVSAPVKVQGLTRGRPTLSSRLSESVARLVKYMIGPRDCPYCQAQGRLDCARCNNTGTITCPRCGGKDQITCTRCQGSGMLNCSRCRGSGWMSCPRCNGSGQLRCGTCGGDGQVTRYQTETRTRQVRRLISAGFDEYGQPYEQWGYDIEEYTVQVPVSDTCPSCGGSGQGGTCGSCSGDGKVVCSRCDGSGAVTCGRCKGTGLVKCPTCKGKGEITCPDCKGRQATCPMCKGKGRIGG